MTLRALTRLALAASLVALARRELGLRYAVRRVVGAVSSWRQRRAIRRRHRRPRPYLPTDVAATWRWVGRG